MILPEKTKGLLDATGGDTEEALASSFLGGSSEYQPEPASTSRTITPPPPPLYSSYSAPISSYYAPTSTAEAARSVPWAPGRPQASFSRVPARDLMYPSFQPMFLVANGKTLDKGFPHASPPSKSDPHPFLSHDITEGDWISFLEEARIVATLTEKQIARSYLPIVSIVPIVSSLASSGVRRIMKSRNAAKVIDCMEQWNRHFFELRKLRVVLMRGQVNVSGQNECMPELVDKHDDIYRLFVVPLS